MLYETQVSSYVPASYIFLKNSPLVGKTRSKEVEICLLIAIYTGIQRTIAHKFILQICMDTFEIIPYDEKYLDTISHLYNSWFSSEAWGNVYTGEYFNEHITLRMQDTTCRCFLLHCTQTNDIIAYRIGYAHSQTMVWYFCELWAANEIADIITQYKVPPQEIFRIDDIVVHEQHRNQGYWTVLVQHACINAKNEWYSDIFLYTLSKDPQLKRFYERLWFTYIWSFLDHLSNKFQDIFAKKL